MQVFLGSLSASCMIPKVLGEIEEGKPNVHSFELLLGLLGMCIFSGYIYSRLSYSSFKRSYIGYQILLSLSVEIYLLYNDKPLIVLALFLVSQGGVHVLERNYVAKNSSQTSISLQVVPLNFDDDQESKYRLTATQTIQNSIVQRIVWNQYYLMYAANILSAGLLGIAINWIDLGQQTL